MIKLLIVADDFTGALDTGVKFAQAGSSTVVLSRQFVLQEDLHADADVLVVDAQTRHQAAEDAYRVVYELTRLAASYPEICLYKKTDSALRGNIGSELTAMLDASGEDSLAFIPAFPQQNRITVHSVQLADGKPLSEGVFGKDLFEPITCSYIPELIGRQSDIATTAILKEQYHEAWDLQKKQILVFDAVCQEDIITIASELESRGLIRVMAGCAGFASILPGLLSLNGQVPSVSLCHKRIAVICGSVNPIAREQMQRGQSAGIRRLTLSAPEILSVGFNPTSYVEKVMRFLAEDGLAIIDANDLQYEGEKMAFAQQAGLTREDTRITIASRLGAIAKHLLAHSQDTLLACIGGDTLAGFMEQMGIEQLIPAREVTPGCVLSIAQTENTAFPVISKSGGLGQPDWLTDLIKSIRGEQ